MNSVTESSGITSEQDRSEILYDIVGLGEIVVDLLLRIPHFPNPDEKLYVDFSEKQAGGVTANFCVGVARQGLRVAFVGSVGSDDNGKFLRKSLVEEGVVDNYLFDLENKITPVNIVMVEKDGQKAILQSEHMRLTLPSKQLITQEIIKEARHLHLTAINFPTALKAARIAKKLGLSVSLDLESQVVQEHSKNLPELLQYIDLLLPNKKGAYTFTNATRPRVAAIQLLEYGPKVVIITLGSKGVLLSTKEFQQSFSAFPVGHVIDTTGAGDAFNAGFVSAYLRNKTWIECVRRGQGTAALKIQGMGAQKSLPSSTELNRFLSNH
ncbi:MAG: carbohydrate kinase family protein [Candidatus Hodarchaeales archaeon]|jgi:ribokinase